MTSQQVAFINSIVLLIVGFWGYAANNFAMHTAIVPIGSGILFLILSKFLKTPAKGLLMLMMTLALALVIAFTVPFLRNVEQGDFAGMFRLVVEMAACAFAFIMYLRNLKLLKKANKA
jgi:uncharacterized membrane protein (UPF0136 family)